MKLSEQLNDAIKHYQEGVATAAERQLVDEFYASFEQEGTEVDVAVTGTREDLEKVSLAQIQARIDRQQAVAEAAPVVKMALYKKLAVAAAVIVVASGLYWWFRSTSGQPVQQPIAITDAAPGGNKAVLTLADGSQITLRDAANGMLANQDGVQVIKLDSGRLTYSLPTGREGNGGAVYNTLSTPRGGQYQLSLPDGTKVWLNASSSIRYPVAFTGAERKVEVTGEVYFEVSPLPAFPGGEGEKKPFIVVANKAAIRVLGTHFNVMAYPEEKAMQTTLLEGAVRVESNDQQALLKPGQQGMVDHASGALSVREVDAQEVVAWVHGQLSMKHADVAAFMRQVSRWYDVDVVFEGEVPAMSFSGSINKMVNLSLVLKALNDNGIPVSLVNGKLIVKQ